MPEITLKNTYENLGLITLANGSQKAKLDLEQLEPNVRDDGTYWYWSECHLCAISPEEGDILRGQPRLIVTYEIDTEDARLCLDHLLELSEILSKKLADILPKLWIKAELRRLVEHSVRVRAMIKRAETPES